MDATNLRVRYRVVSVEHREHLKLGQTSGSSVADLLDLLAKKGPLETVTLTTVQLAPVCTCAACLERRPELKTEDAAHKAPPISLVVAGDSSFQLGREYHADFTEVPGDAPAPLHSN